jgi:hypothetical protein
MTLPTTIAALYPFLVLFLQAAAVPGAGTTRSLVEVERSAELPIKMETPTPTTQPAGRVTIEYKRIAPNNAELTVTTGDPGEQVRYIIHLQPAEARSDRKSR